MSEEGKREFLPKGYSACQGKLMEAWNMAIMINKRWTVSGS